MDNKLSELSKPVDFLKSATLITARNFERWSKLAAMTSESSSVLHSTTLLETAQLLSALLAELEAVKAENALFRETGDYLIQTAYCAQERATAADAKLATPVRLPEGLAQKIKVTGYYEALNEMMDCVRAAGFKCVGDE